GNAKYWLGETHYVRGQYHDAAITFAEGYQQYPTSKKAPDNLLKLGKSLAALGETTDACGTYSELTRRFPNASATILQQADQERRRLACP
ncbi:MAG: tetratricopeptide repeat protein, partial [Kiloniellales bacterium]